MMTKAERLVWIKQRHQLHEDAVFGETPPSKEDIAESLGELEPLKEYQRDLIREKNVLNSDES